MNRDKIVEVAKEYGIIADAEYVETDISVDDLVEFVFCIINYKRDEYVNACYSLQNSNNTYNAGILDCCDVIKTRGES